MDWYHALPIGTRVFLWATAAVATGGFLLRVLWLWRYWT